MKRNRMGAISESIKAHMEEVDTGSAEKHLFTLCTGRKVEFIAHTIPAEKVESTTYVAKHNRRLEAEVKLKSVEGMVKSIKRQQYFPAITIRVGDKYEIADGSRRRYAAIQAEVELKIIYCTERLTSAEIKALAIELQSAEEHSYRDHGSYYSMLLNDKENLMSAEQIIEEEGISPMFYKRCLRAWEVPASLVNLFELPSRISHSQFSKLTKVTKTLKDNSSLELFVSSIKIESGTNNDEVMAFIYDEAGFNKPKNTAYSRKFVELSKDKFVKVAVTKNKTTFEVTRGTQKEVEDIENLIKEYFSKTK